MKAELWSVFSMQRRIDGGKKLLHFQFRYIEAGSQKGWGNMCATGGNCKVSKHQHKQEGYILIQLRLMSFPVLQ